VGAGAAVDRLRIYLVVFWFNVENWCSAYFFLEVVDGVSVVYEKKGMFGLLRQDIERFRELF
jgi:hypothetical protein